MNDTLEILSPAHPRWKEFLGQLAGPEGCDFREKDDGNWEWECDGSNARARAILQKMGGLDVDGTVAYFREHGGFCDCEIVFNVGEDDASIQPDGEEE